MGGGQAANRRQGLSDRKACMLLAEDGTEWRGPVTVEQWAEKLRRNHRTVEQSLKNILG